MKGSRSYRKLLHYILYTDFFHRHSGAIHASENTTIYEEFNGTVQCLSNRIELEGMREFVRALVSLH